jgi:hypothetical protein
LGLSTACAPVTDAKAMRTENGKRNGMRFLFFISSSVT